MAVGFASIADFVRFEFRLDEMLWLLVQDSASVWTLKVVGQEAEVVVKTPVFRTGLHLFQDSSNIKDLYFHQLNLSKVQVKLDHLEHIWAQVY